MSLEKGTQSVTLKRYNSSWKIEFEKEKKELKKTLNDYAISIEHIGSTSIPNLQSKPIIDIAIGVKKIDLNYIKEKFKNLSNYVVLDKSVPNEILVVKGKEDETTHLIHVMKIDGSRYKDIIMFRDYLLEHPDEIKKYEKLKKELAKKYVNDRKQYTSSKNEFIKEILKKAYADPEFEILDIYNCDGILTGKTIQRGNKNLNENEYIMLSVVFIKNNKNQFLIQKTSKEKGKVYSTTGGHVLHKETPIEAIIRELKEELGLIVEKENLKFIDKKIIENKPCIFNIFYLEMNINIDNLDLQDNEVEKILWLNEIEIRKLIKENKFLQSHGILFETNI